MTAGQPTLYKPEYCKQATDLMADGYSMLAVAGEFNVSRPTLQAWCKAHPEFKQAIEIGKAKATKKWETRLNKIGDAGGGNGSSTVTLFALKNLGRTEWQDKQSHEHTGADGGPIETIQKVEYVIVDGES